MICCRRSSKQRKELISMLLRTVKGASCAPFTVPVLNPEYCDSRYNSVNGTSKHKLEVTQDHPREHCEMNQLSMGFVNRGAIPVGIEQ